MSLGFEQHFNEVTADAISAERERTHLMYPPIMRLISLLAMIGILAYAVFLFNPMNRGDVLPYSLVIIAETILIFHALMAMWIILSGARGSRPSYFYPVQRAMFDPAVIGATSANPGDPRSWPITIGGRVRSVDVLITVYGEALDVIERTARAALDIRGRHGTYILDDGDSDEVRELAQRLGCSYLRRLTHHGAKAGNLNSALTVAKGEFFVIVDADFVARPNLLEETLPFMHDDRVAFVQTPQVYGNMHNILSRGAGFMQTMFYKYIQTGRNQFNAAFCVGTNVVFRRAAVMEIGGMYTGSKSEDVWTSLFLHEKGWRSVYTPITVAVGDVPDTVESYSKQQLRWATGGFEILFTHNPLAPRRTLDLGQRIMYFVTASYYLLGIAPGLLMAVPLLEIFFDLHPMNMMSVTWWQWALFYSGFYVLQIALATVVLGKFRWEVLVLSMCSFPIYTKALFNGLLGIDTRWSATGALRKRASAFNFMIPQIYMFAILLIGLGTSIWRDVTLGFFNIATMWLAINTVALGAFLSIGIQESAEARALARGQLAREPLRPGDPFIEPMPELDRSAIVRAKESISMAAQEGSWAPDDHAELTAAEGHAQPALTAAPGTLNSQGESDPLLRSHDEGPPRSAPEHEDPAYRGSGPPDQGHPEQPSEYSPRRGN
ncbi:cellulose synthase (UDP-forming) [Propionibacterium cyclohexanicum]|uniref:Cellulose synthase (UDP-forming) n=1 Tax=Propionibacterium cyclohexanicum TaxID=64702 RepID=A0A1H9RGW0_9ACTN|nr:cellulose synthase catalytic subunit [Propionibacterium cyclohexanicum]SER71219.1 cellulose synthase (UDP-forming) [Propionibacterium cyclohexanicum]